MCQLKKKLHSVRVANYVYLGQNEDDSLGDSILESSENLLQGEVDLGKGGGVHAIKHLFFGRKFLLVL